MKKNKFATVHQINKLIENRTFMRPGMAVQNADCGRTSFPSAFILNFMIMMPTTKYAINSAKTLHIEKSTNKILNPFELTL